MKAKHSNPYLLFEIATAAVALTVTGTSAQNIYVANWFSPGAIYSITPGGSMSTFSSYVGSEPEGLAFDRSGDLFVGDSGNGDVYEYALGGSKSTVATALGGGDVNSVAFNSSGDLFVSGYGNGDIYELAPGATSPTVFATGLNHPFGLAFNSSGNLFVAENGTSSIYEYAPDGTKTKFATGYSGLGYLAFDPSGNLYAGGGSYIYKFAPNGAESLFDTFLQSGVGGMAFDSSGDMFIANGQYLTEIRAGGGAITLASGLGNATGVAIQPAVVPEPCTMALMLLGGTGTLFRRRKP